MRFETIVGLRYLRSKRKEAFISFTTYTAVIGIAIGVMALIVVIAVMTGFQEEIKSRILGISPHIVIMGIKSEISDMERVISLTRNDENVTQLFPFVQFQALSWGRMRQQGILVKSVDFNQLGHLKISDGKDIRSLDVERDAILGKELLRNLNLSLGEEIYILIPFSGFSPLGVSPEFLRFRVGATFETGIYDLDSTLVILSLSRIKNLLGIEATGIELRLKEPYRAQDIKKKLEKGLGSTYSIRTWIEMNKNLFSALKLEKIAMFIILALIIIVASFNIVSSLMMTVYEKRKDIAILKSLGAKDKTILRIFMIEGTVIGILGTAIGSVLGLALCEFIKHYRIDLPQDVYYITSLPAKISFLDVIIVVTLALAISVLSTIYPSIKASRLDPVEVLRYE